MIVCAVDRSRRAHHVARVSRGLAEALDAQVVLTHVFDPMMVPAPPTRELDRLLSTEDIEQHERGLAHRALARTAEFLGDVAYTTVFAEGRPEPENRRSSLADRPSSSRCQSRYTAPNVNTAIPMPIASSA
jgi:hypothetical protein